MKGFFLFFCFLFQFIYEFYNRKKFRSVYFVSESFETYRSIYFPFFLDLFQKMRNFLNILEYSRISNILIYMQKQFSDVFKYFSSDKIFILNTCDLEIVANQIQKH